MPKMARNHQKRGKIIGRKLPKNSFKTNKKMSFKNRLKKTMF